MRIGSRDSFSQGAIAYAMGHTLWLPSQVAPHLSNPTDLGQTNIFISGSRRRQPAPQPKILNNFWHQLFRWKAHREANPS